MNKKDKIYRVLFYDNLKSEELMNVRELLDKKGINYRLEYSPEQDRFVSPHHRPTPHLISPEGSFSGIKDISWYANSFF